MSKEILDEIIKSNKPTSNIFLLYGEEAFLRAHYKKSLKGLFMPESMPDLNYYSFDGRDYSLSAVDEAIEALPVFDDRKLLIFDNSMLFKPDARTGAKAEVREYWEKRLKDIPEYVYIIFNETEIDKRSSIFKFISKNYISTEFSYLDEGKMVRWTQTLFKRLGKIISPDDCTYLINLCPDGMMSVKTEAEKLCSYAKDKQNVTREDIDLLVVPKLEDKVFDMVSAILEKDIDKSLTLLKNLIALKTEPTQILGAILYNVEKIASVKLLLSSKRTKQEIASALKIAPFQVNKFSDIASRFKKDELERLIHAAATKDMQLKTNSMDNNVLLEVFIMETASQH
ncbi:MAG: DNA polymerase III subunit delta [Ruminococcaceae bacterium]|nr:DNA polymerase III subunit delta [Oscillospiraceae bacterium]